jgi:hypothetical protein
MRRFIASFVVATAAAFGLIAVAVPATAVSTDIEVPATAGGPDNGGTPAVFTLVDIPDGASITVNASGTIHICGESGCPNGPDGGNPGNSTANSLVPNSPYGCLAARVGSGPWSCIGSSAILDGPGEVQFAVNDDFVGPGVGYEDNFGSFTVVVGEPTRAVSVTIRLGGGDPGVAFPVTITCTSTPTADVTGAVTVSVNQIGELVLGSNDTKSITFNLPPSPPNAVPIEGPLFVRVWWPVSGVENVTCTVSENLTALPAGVACTASFAPNATAVLYDLSDEIDQSVHVEITNTCAVPIPPNFTG